MIGSPVRPRPILAVLQALLFSTLLAAPVQAACPNGSCITYTLDTSPRSVYRIEAIAGASPQNVSAALNAIDPVTGSTDQQLNVSPDGQWLVLTTDHFDASCAGQGGCLGLVTGNLSSGEAVRPGGTLVTPDGIAAVASGGNAIVYPDSDGTVNGHFIDLFLTTRSGPGGAWSAPVPITADSTFVNNEQPAIRDDGSSVLFNCRNTFDSSQVSICEVGTNGQGFRVVLSPADLPPRDGIPQSERTLAFADYARDGSIVFEDGQYVFRLRPGTQPFIINDAFNNDVSPCVFPSGDIVSLWTDRPDATVFARELKVMDANGGLRFILNPGVDTSGIGIGCGAPLCLGSPVTISGTAGNDSLVGTAGADVIAAGAGNDTIDAGGGDDKVCAGPGADSVRGGSGNDSIKGRGLGDFLHGEAGDDDIRGNAGNDTIRGGDGVDRLQGGVGTDDCADPQPETQIIGCP